MKRADEDDFHAYVSARMDRWRRTAYLLCQDWHTADDLVSITVTKLFRNWRKVRAADNRDAYAQRVLSRSWLDESRRASRREWSRPEPVEVAWTALGLSMTGGTGASSPPSATGASAGATAPDSQFALVALTEESAAASAKNLSRALGAALRETAPGARWIAEPGVEGRDTPDGEPPVLSYHVGKDERKAHELFNGGTGVLNQGRKGSLHLGVEPAEGLGEDGVPRHNELTCPPSGRDCEVGRAPSGTRLVFQTWASGDIRTYSYEVALPDGRILRLLISNSFGAGGGPAPQKDTPLTRDQLKAITLDVAARVKA